jgi:hypothetical protein
MRPFTVLALMVGVGAAATGGYLAGRRTPPPRAVRCAEPSAPESIAAAAPSRAMPPDYQALKNQLAICMAYHPPAEETDHLPDPRLAACEHQLEAERKERPTRPSCYDFEDATPTYDRQLGAVGDTSPEMAERAAHLTLDDCAAIRVLSWRAEVKQRTCLKGTTPIGWKERYGSSMNDRPLVKACWAAFSTVDLANAVLSYQEQQIREAGGVIRRSIRHAPDGGLIEGPVDPEPRTP